MPCYISGLSQCVQCMYSRSGVPLSGLVEVVGYRGCNCTPPPNNSKTFSPERTSTYYLVPINCQLSIVKIKKSLPLKLQLHKGMLGSQCTRVDGRRDGVHVEWGGCRQPPSTSFLHCTDVRFASFLSGGFTTMAVINPPERKLAKGTSVQCIKKKRF